MASDSVQSGEESGLTRTVADDQIVDLHILSPSPEAPQRFTFHGLPLSTKVSEVKARITLAVASRPDPESQRLIYRGKVLTSNGETLHNIVDPPGTRAHTMHLVLPPSAIPHSRPALESSITSPGRLRPNAESSQSSLGQNATSLRFRGPHTGSRDRLREYLRECAEEVENTTLEGPSFSQQQQPARSANPTDPAHASVPPLADRLAGRQSSASPSRNTSTSTAPIYVTDASPHRESFPAGRTAPLSGSAHGQFGQGGPQPSVNPSHHHQGRIDALLQRYGRSGDGQQMTQNGQAQGEAMPGQPNMRTQTNAILREHGVDSRNLTSTQLQVLQARNPVAQQHSSQLFSENFLRSTMNNQAVSGGVNNPNIVAGEETMPTADTQGGVLPNQDRRQRLALLLQRILTMENQLRAGSIPSVDEISNVRFQLHQLLDEQYRNPLQLREAPLEAWLARLSTTAMRADQLRVAAGHHTPPGITTHTTFTNATTAGSDASQAPMYLLSSPDGHYGVVMSPAGLSGVNSQAVAAAGNAAPGPRPNVVGRARQPITPTFRVGIHNNPPAGLQHRRTLITSGDLMRVARGLWLFMRLYFFCYLITHHGSWLRTILAVLAAITAVISQTSVPRQVQRVAWEPVRRHLENLVPLERQQGQRHRPAHNAGNADNDGPPDFNQRIPQMQTQTAVPEPTATGVIRDSVMRAERAVVMFLATLVPGIGERYVAASNAAEAARQNAEQRRQEGENEEQQEQNGEGAGDDAATGAQTDTAEVPSSGTPSHTSSNEIEEGASGNRQDQANPEQP